MEVESGCGGDVGWKGEVVEDRQVVGIREAAKGTGDERGPTMRPEVGEECLPTPV